ncbi:MAG: cell division protein FtsL [Chromatiales bacterium]|jgi:cell division protein FtsL|nr:MAG: cell division protein FtsL [Chromatiales bacterium]
MTPAQRSRAVFSSLAAAVLISALASVYAKHQSRKLFVEMQGLVAERDRLEIDWGRLQIEQSTQANHARVESIARERLSMRTPTPDDVKLVAR